MSKKKTENIWEEICEKMEQPYYQRARVHEAYDRANRLKIEISFRQYCKMRWMADHGMGEEDMKANMTDQELIDATQRWHDANGTKENCPNAVKGVNYLQKELKKKLDIVLGNTSTGNTPRIKARTLITGQNMVFLKHFHELERKH